MGVAVQVVTGRVLNPSTTVTAFTANTGDSFTVNNFDNAAPATLDQVWGDNASGGIVRIRSPRLHDQAQGIRLQLPAAGDPKPLLDTYADQTLYASDSLIVEGTGGAAETDTIGLLNYYTNLPGANARVVNWSDIASRIVNLMGSEVDTTSGGTAGDWGAGAAINATFDNFKANTDYAVLGWTTNVFCTAVAIAGPDTANYRTGGPGSIDPLVTRNWFVKMNAETGRPYIPVFNSNNRGGTLCYVAAATASKAVKVSLLLAQLS